MVVILVLVGETRNDVGVGCGFSFELHRMVPGCFVLCLGSLSAGDVSWGTFSSRGRVVRAAHKEPDKLWSSAMLSKLAIDAE